MDIGQSFQINFPAITPAVHLIVENDIFTKPYTCISIQATIAGRPLEIYMGRIKEVGRIGNFRNNIKLEGKKRTMSNKIEEIERRTEINEDEFGFLTHSGIFESVLTENQDYKHLRDTCMSCGLVDCIRFDDEELTYSFELNLIEDACQTAGIHTSIFKKLALKTFRRKNYLSTITDIKHFINEKSPRFRILTIKYNSFVEMLLDMVSAVNYINERLEKDNNN